MLDLERNPASRKNKNDTPTLTDKGRGGGGYIHDQDLIKQATVDIKTT
jgi:hypothetical protein